MKVVRSEELFRKKPVFINLGVRSFGESLRDAGCEVIFVDWSPPAGGTRKWQPSLMICSEGTFSEQAPCSPRRVMGAAQGRVVELGPAIPLDASIRRALSIGPAASLALSPEGARLRVHQVFASAVNLEVEEMESLVTLTGPGGEAYPHAVVLGLPADFSAWRVAAGSSGCIREGAIRLQGRAGHMAVDLTRAQRRPRRSLPRIAGRGAAHRSCMARLSALQEQSGCDLRMDGLLRDPPAATVLGEALCKAALALGEAARGYPGASGGRSADHGLPRRWEAGPYPSLGRPVAALMGLGAGLTPSGDDFLCGFLAAARSCRPGPVPGDQGLISALHRALEENLRCTSQISAGLLRWAARDFWPTPLLELAEALAGERENQALQALAALARLGHSSGADLATGFLFGLETLPVESR